MFRFNVAAGLRICAMLVALMGLGNAAYAQQPSTAQIQVAREVVVASGATRAFDGVIPSIMQQTLNVYLQQNPDLQKDLLESIKAIAGDFEKRQGEIIDIIARIYATRFNDAELKEILSFYRSATGKKFVAQIPGILEESFVKTQEWGGKMSEEVTVRLRAEMKKRGHTI